MEKTFATLMHDGIKLNPAKCIFGVKSGKFLGFIVTDWGIEVNQEKVKSMLCKPSPRSVKEVQKLTRRIASMSRFISRSAHMSYPFFQVLIKEEGSDQKPVYYVSYALRGPELRYNEIEKIVLALIMTPQKLRPYFLSHQIIVLTNSPLDRIMTHSEIKGIYEAKEDMMIKYLQLIQAQARTFVDWSIEKIPREENEEADALAKMASSQSEVSTREVLHVSRLVLPLEEEALSTLENSWMTPLIKFIMNNELPEDKARAQKIKRQAPSPATLMKTIWASCPFDQWGMDIVGPFAIAGAQKKFLLMAVDYLSKWVEAEPLAKITEQEVLKFLWKNIVCRFGVPRRLISDNGRQFQGKEITSWCREMNITQSFTSVAYPQANGQTEVVNRIIVQALKTRLHGKGKDWVEELPSVLWAYRTTPREPTQETSFNLVYGSEVVLPVEIGQTSSRVESYPEDNDQSWAMELDLVEEKRDRAVIKMEAYRSRVMKSYNRKVRIRYFQVGDLFMKKVNPAGDVGKLEARWEGPYKITQRVSTGYFYLEDAQGRLLKRPWNVFNLKKYYA
ncbi:uncharacterized protein [Primulina eburnea]|uniref:uncharacterized protein n=1 Tax=Primulina eburnea TaxID=1245227 RepID=UPI003C6C4B78